ncbi:MAG: sigma-54 dependent transcriptional regulator [Proteobacteria bacterium]|nr:sigma-54 dependent transcriptional regulator [Pseudomonadota bacterium]MBU1686480.1 sigma-54 dependent transcriptional regulator [Pseudomonadota bacterium]
MAVIPKIGRILIVDDDSSHRFMLSSMLRQWGWSTEEADDGTTAVKAVEQRNFDAILMDVRMTLMDGIEALKAIHILNPVLPIVIMTAYSTVDAAVEAMREGAHDYLTKPLDFERLQLTLAKAMEFRQVAEAVRAPGNHDTIPGQFPGIIHQSSGMADLLKMVEQVAPTEATVLISGESGTGKELIASALHRLSSRNGQPFVKVNCAALVDTLLESELFGHEKGAFTGADRRKDGKFLQADGGTIFLDEIGETSTSMQVKLLRVLQEHEVQRVGGQETLSVDVRVVAASNRILEEEVKNGRFREDLYYRLNVVALHIPSLRERPKDIPPLVEHFAQIFAKKNGRGLNGITPVCLAMLTKYPWPGNVRELENAIERGIILMRGDYLDEESLPLSIHNWFQKNNITPTMESSPSSLEDAEKMVIEQTLRETDWNKSESARRLRITRKTLQSKLKKYGLSPG